MTPNSAFLLLSYGAPENEADVQPFLEKLNVPQARFAEAIRKYAQIGFCSPVMEECRRLLSALEDELDKIGPKMPLYWGNLYWHPLLENTIDEMLDDGIERAYVFATSAFCSPTERQNDRYDEAIAKFADKIDLIRLPFFYDNELFLSAQADRLLDAIARATLEWGPFSENQNFGVLFSAHSVPNEIAEQSGYKQQVEFACQKIANLARVEFPWRISWQSGRKGEPHAPHAENWLSPTVEEQIADFDVSGIIVLPIGFLLENMETQKDLDIDAAAFADSQGKRFFRGDCVGCDVKIIRLIRDLL